MKEEIEVKILEINATDLIARLTALKAEKVFQGMMVSTYFDAPDGKIRAKGQTLRLRTEGERTILCFKDPKSRSRDSARIEEEYEIIVSDHAGTQALLERLGFLVFAHDERARTIFALGGSTIDITEYDDIPPFAEIESPSMTELESVVHQLGYTMRQTSILTGGEVLAKYRTRGNSNSEDAAQRR